MLFLGAMAVLALRALVSLRETHGLQFSLVEGGLFIVSTALLLFYALRFMRFKLSRSRK